MTDVNSGPRSYVICGGGEEDVGDTVEARLLFDPNEINVRSFVTAGDSNFCLADNHHDDTDDDDDDDVQLADNNNKCARTAAPSEGYSAVYRWYLEGDTGKMPSCREPSDKERPVGSLEFDFSLHCDVVVGSGCGRLTHLAGGENFQCATTLDGSVFLHSASGFDVDKSGGRGSNARSDNIARRQRRKSSGNENSSARQSVEARQSDDDPSTRNSSPSGCRSTSTSRRGSGSGSGLSGRVPVWRRIDMPRKVVSTSCGWSFVHAVTEGGELFAWGSCERGGLGLGPLITTCTAPRQVTVDVTIDDFVWPERYFEKPKQEPARPKSHHLINFVGSRKGPVGRQCFSASNFGTRATDQSDSNTHRLANSVNNFRPAASSRPASSGVRRAYGAARRAVQHRKLVRVGKVASGLHHVLAVVRRDSLEEWKRSAGGSAGLSVMQSSGFLAWGCGEDGRLGTCSDANAIVPYPIFVSLTPALWADKLATLALDSETDESEFDDTAGTDTATFSGMLRASRKLFERSSASWLSQTEESSVPLVSRSVQTAENSNFSVSMGGGFARQRVSDIRCGFSHSLVLTDDGDVYSFGRNDAGQLGTDCPLHLRGGKFRELAEGAGYTAGKRQGKIVAAIRYLARVSRDRYARVVEATCRDQPRSSAGRYRQSDTFDRRCDKSTEQINGETHTSSSSSSSSSSSFATSTSYPLERGGDSYRLHAAKSALPSPSSSTSSSSLLLMPQRIDLRTPPVEANAKPGNRLCRPGRSGQIATIKTIDSGPYHSAALATSGAIFVWGKDAVLRKPMWCCPASCERAKSRKFVPSGATAGSRDESSTTTGNNQDERPGSAVDFDFSPSDAFFASSGIMPFPVAMVPFSGTDTKVHSLVCGSDYLAVTTSDTAGQAVDNVGNGQACEAAAAAVVPARASAASLLSYAAEVAMASEARIGSRDSEESGRSSRVANISAQDRSKETLSEVYMTIANVIDGAEHKLTGGGIFAFKPGTTGTDTKMVISASSSAPLPISDIHPLDGNLRRPLTADALLAEEGTNITPQPQRRGGGGSWADGLWSSSKSLGSLNNDQTAFFATTNWSSSSLNSQQYRRPEAFRLHEPTFRPDFLPPKTFDELAAHRRMVAALEGRFLSQARSEIRALKFRKAFEEGIRMKAARKAALWRERYLPDFKKAVDRGIPPPKEIQDIWRQGLPSEIRGEVWPLAIGNSLRITPELYSICLKRARELRAVEEFRKGRREQNKELHPSPSSFSPTMSPELNGCGAEDESVNTADILGEDAGIVVGARSMSSVVSLEIQRGVSLNNGEIPLFAESTSVCIYGDEEEESDATQRPGTVMVERDDEVSVNALHSSSSSSSLTHRSAAGCVEQGDAFAQLLEGYRAEESRETSVDCIGLDLPRTLPHLGGLVARRQLHARCRNLLEAWTVYRPDIGYVQGMSYLAAMLAVHLPPFPAFTVFCNLMSSPSLLGLYKMTPPQVSRRYGIFSRLLGTVCPVVAQHLADVDLPPDFYLLEWLLTLFVKPLSMEAATVIWDLYLLEGEPALYATAAALLKILAPKLESTDFENSRAIVQNVRHHVPSGTELLHQTCVVLRGMSSAFREEVACLAALEFSPLAGDNDDDDDDDGDDDNARHSLL